MWRKEQGTATQMIKILLGLSYILIITKENRGRNSGRTEAAVVAEGAGGSGLQPQHQWQWRRRPTAAMAGAGNVDPLIPDHGRTMPRSISFTRQHHINVAREPSWLS